MHPALVLATITVLISGSDPATEKRVRAAFDRAPECLGGAMDDGEIEVVKGSLNANYSADQGSVRNALANKEGPERLELYIRIYDRLLLDVERGADGAAAERAACARPGAVESFLGNIDRVVLHEIAHAFHFDDRGGGRRFDIDQFLEIRWREAYDAWAEDPERIRIHDEYLAAVGTVQKSLASGREPTPAQLEQICALQKELDAKFGDMPSRMPGDYHAHSRNDGAEYFAIAIETLAYAPDVFCKSYSAAEIAWLKDMLGQCLAQLKKRAACFDAMPAAGGAPQKPQGAGIRRD